MTLDERTTWSAPADLAPPVADSCPPGHHTPPQRQNTRVRARLGRAVRRIFTRPGAPHRPIRQLNEFLEPHRMEREMHRL